MRATTEPTRRPTFETHLSRPAAALALHPVLRALVVALAITAVLAVATVLASLAAGDSPRLALRAASALEGRKLAGPSGMDSWGAMWSGLHRQQSGPSVYAAALLLDNCKYQYPPSALLLMEALPHPEGPHLCSRDAEAGEPPLREAWPFKVWIDFASLVSVLATCGLAVVLLRRGLAAGGDQADLQGPRQPLLAALLVLLLGLSFFPLVWGHSLGQVQVQINLALAAALWARLAGHAGWSGALLGLCCLLKPTYALFLGWALLRREWRLAVALALVAAAGHGLALWRYGSALHVEYLEFLRGLGRLGESYWANQSLTGLLLRWIEPGSGLQWADSAFGSSALPQHLPPEFDWESAGFPEHHIGVTLATVVFSLLLLGAAFWPVRGATAATPLARTLDLAFVMAAVTVASPIVWWHHFGSFFAIFALALAAAASNAPGSGRLVASTALWVQLGLAYALLGSAVLQPERLPALLGSHGWVGALLLMAVLWRLRRACSGAERRT